MTLIRARLASRLFTIVWLTAWFLVVIAPLRAQSPAPPLRSRPSPAPPTRLADTGHPGITVFTDAHGLPQNAIQCQAVDARGYLWAGTLDGAAYFNGIAWKPVSLPDGKKSNSITFIRPASDESLWFGTESGLHHRTATGWETFDRTKGLSDDFIEFLYEVKTGPARGFWVATHKGIHRLRDGQWTVFTKNLPHPVSQSFAELKLPDGRTTFLAGTDRGLVEFDHEDWKPFASPPELDTASVSFMLNVGDEANDVGETIWLTTENSRGTFRLEKGQWRRFAIEDGFPSNRGLSVATTTGVEGKIVWIGTDRGLVRVAPDGSFRHYGVAQGLPQDFTFSLAVTGHGGQQLLWVGSLLGICRIIEGKWVAVDTRSGVNLGMVLSLLETKDADGGRTFWIGTFENGLFRWKNGEWKRFGVPEGLPTRTIWRLRQTFATGPIPWAVCAGGIVKLNGETLEKITGPDATALRAPTDLLDSVTETGKPCLWFSTAQGLLQFSEGNWRSLKVADGLADNDCAQLLETRDDAGRRTLWIATLNGLSSLSEGKFRTYRVADGLAGNQVIGLFEKKLPDGRHFLWIGTRAGVSRLDLKTGEWFKLDDKTTPALPNNVVYQIQEDDRGRLYFSTNRGIARVTLDDPGGKKATLETFGLEDGLPSLECNRGAAFRDDEGRLWFGTLAGAAMFDPRRELPDTTPKRLNLEAVFVNERPVPAGNGLSLSHRENTVGFEYALLSYFRQTDTRYRTQLVGLENEPSEWTPDTKREYRNLEPGSYRFVVTGRDAAGNETVLRGEWFSIRPAPWQTWWAYLFYILIVAGAAFALYRARLSFLETRNRELQAIVTERTREIEAQKDALSEANLKLQELDEIKAKFTAMLVHDLKSPLSVVRATLDFAEEDQEVLNSGIGALVSPANRSLDRVLALINEMLDVFKSDSQEIKLALEPVAAETFFREIGEENTLVAKKAGIQFKFDFETSLPELNADRMQLSRVFSNLISNAVKFTPKNGTITFAGRVIEGTGVETGLKLLLVTVTDTGEGIPADVLPYVFDPYRQGAGYKTRLGVGLGLAIAKRIVAAHGGNITVRSQVGVGTSFNVTLPVLKKVGSQGNDER